MRMKEYTVTGVVLKTTTKETYAFPETVKRLPFWTTAPRETFARSLNQRGCEVTVYPADTPAEKVLAGKPDGIMLSNGPGDPKENTAIIREVKKLYESDVPIFAICLGHQLISLACGANTVKLKFGHRGCNHPVVNLATGKVEITSQNHGYAVEAESLAGTQLEMTHQVITRRVWRVSAISNIRFSVCSTIRRLHRGRRMRTICLMHSWN